MRALVTGAGGFMGPHLVRLLQNKGSEVFGTYHDPKSDLSELKCDKKDLDVRDKTKFKKTLRDFIPDRVYHLAAQSYPTVSWEKPNYTIQTNVEGTINLFESLKELNLNPIVLVACSSAEYGYVTEDEVPIKEEQGLLPLHPYGVSKVAQDLLTYQYFKNFSLLGIRARIFNTTGPGKLEDVCSDFTKQAVLVEKGKQKTISVGNLDTKRAITDVRDIINGFYLLAEYGFPGAVYNMSGDNVYLMKDIIEKVIKISGVNAEIEVDKKLLRPTDEPIIFGDSSKLKEDTGWEQKISIDKTLSDMIEWWRERIDG